MQESENELTRSIIGGAMRVHTRLGPGLLESAYEQVLAHELRKRGLRVEQQVPLELRYDDLRIETAYRLDLLVESTVVVEVKSVERFQPVHGLQVLTYMRLARAPLGLLFNFNTNRLANGIQRKILDLSNLPAT